MKGKYVGVDNVQFKVIHFSLVDKTRVGVLIEWQYKEKARYLKKNVSQSHLVQYKYHIDRSGIKSGPSEVRRPVTNGVNQGPLTSLSPRPDIRTTP
jgi:hypothetical protein